MDAKEEVRSRLAIEDVVGEYVHLQRSGRNYKGLSPFTGEKTPSFFVSPEKQIWHDFSSNKGGDVFSFVMEAEGTDFRQALELLARKAGVDLGLYDSTSSRELSKRKKRILEATQWAAKYYQVCLTKNQHAAAYVFSDRHFDKSTVVEFCIGYAPDSGKALVQFLDKKGFSAKELKDAGLVNRAGGDLFRGRMMVSLMDGSGQIIGFTGRIIVSDDTAPKYLNTPQTLCYDKSRHVFGLSQAKSAIRQAKTAVIVEGNLDVISSHQAGVKNVVATAGTAITEHHIKALHRLTDDIRLSFDSDKAGVAATERAIAIADTVGVRLSIISLPKDSKDPDELIQRDPKLWKHAVGSAVPAIEWVIEQYAERADLTSAAGKREFTSAALRLTAKMSDAVEREHYETKVAARIGMSLDAIRQKSGQFESDETESRKKRVVNNEANDELQVAYQDDLLAVAAIDVPSQELLQHIDVESLVGQERQTLAKYLVTHRGQALISIPKDLQSIETYVKIVTFRAETRYADWSEHDRYYEAARLIRQLEYEQKKQKRTDLQTKLRAAEEGGNDHLAHQLREQLNVLIKEIARGQRR